MAVMAATSRDATIVQFSKRVYAKFVNVYTNTAADNEAQMVLSCSQSTYSLECTCFLFLLIKS